MAEAADFSNIRTLEDLINLVSILYFNMSKVESLYYDIFINPDKKVVELERYDDTGKLIKVPIKNRALDMIRTYSGAGDPNGQQAAEPGALYIDLQNNNCIYYKASGTGNEGWFLLWSQDNLREGSQYLSPSGSAPNLRDLNMNNASSGNLSVKYGGTGVGIGNLINGIVKGDGTNNPMTAAVAGVDYVAPNTLVGVVCYYPVNADKDGNDPIIPRGWLRCDGGSYSRSTYKNLYKVLGTTYGATDESHFNVPNLYNHFIRCWDETSTFNRVQEPNIGSHSHTLNFTSGSESGHKHTRGTMNITGSFAVTGMGNSLSGSGAFYQSGWRAGDGDGDGGINGGQFTFDASRNWSGSTSGGSAHSHNIRGTTAAAGGSSTETIVLNKMMVPIIKY